MSRRLTWKDIDAGWIPRLESWRCSQKAMGFEISMGVMKRVYKPLVVLGGSKRTNALFGLVEFPCVNV